MYKTVFILYFHIVFKIIHHAKMINSDHFISANYVYKTLQFSINISYKQAIIKMIRMSQLHLCNYSSVVYELPLIGFQERLVGGAYHVTSDFDSSVQFVAKFYFACFCQFLLGFLGWQPKDPEKENSNVIKVLCYKLM